MFLIINFHIFVPTQSYQEEKQASEDQTTSSRSFFMQLFHLSDIVTHCFLLGFSFNSLPCVPLCPVPHVEHTRAACIHRSNSCLLVQSIQNKLVFISSTLGQGLGFLGMLLKFLLQASKLFDIRTLMASLKLH